MFRAWPRRYGATHHVTQRPTASHCDAPRHRARPGPRSTPRPGGAHPTWHARCIYSSEARHPVGR